MALSKAQKAAKAQKRIDEARAMLALAEAEGEAAGIVGSKVEAPAIAGANYKNTSTVWVGCKLPRGLVLRMHKKVVVDQKTFGGGIKPTEVFMPDPERGTVRLKGYAVPFGKVPNYSIIGDFGLTEVDRAWWDEWKSINRGFEMLKNGLIFEHGEKVSVEAYAEEHASLRCGLEPMAQSNDPRAEKANSENLTDVEADTDRARNRRPEAA